MVYVFCILLLVFSICIWSQLNYETSTCYAKLFKQEEQTQEKSKSIMDLRDALLESPFLQVLAKLEKLPFIHTTFNIHSILQGFRFKFWLKINFIPDW